MKTKLEDLKKGDVVALRFGFEYIQAIDIGNNGTHVVWYSKDWLKRSAVVSSYEKMESMGWTHIGIKKMFGIKLIA